MTDAGLLRLLLTRFTLRHWRGAPGQAALLVLILSLGVAVYFSIRLANRAVISGFERFTDILTRTTDFSIAAPVGSLPESVLPELRSALGARAVHVIPILDTTAARPPSAARNSIGGAETFRLVGLDLIAIQNLREEDPGAAPVQESWVGAFATKNAVFISRALAERDHLQPGAEFPLLIDDHIVSLSIAGFIPGREGEPAAPATLLIMDLPVAQSVTSRPGQLDRVEFLIESGPNRAARRAEAEEIVLKAGNLEVSDSPSPDAAASQGGSPRWLLSTAKDRRDTGAVMTSAFRMNLTILSLIALLVGLYLIFQALDGAVLRRRQEIAILRSLGVEERTIRRAWLIESALVGVLGGAFGALLGWAGAQLAVRFVGQSVNALYFATSVDSARLTAAESALAIVLATGASLLAGWAPARVASRTPPAQLLSRSQTAGPGPRVLRSGLLGVILLLLGFGFANLPPLRFSGGVRFPLGGYIAAAAWLFAASIASGHVLRWLAPLLRPAGKHSALFRLAVSHIAPPSGRHRLAAASLACAVAMTAGMAILVGSFERTMQRWIVSAFQADLYISSAGAQSASSRSRILPATWQHIASDPAVAAANIMHTADVTFPRGTITVLGVDMPFSRKSGSIAWISGQPTEWPDQAPVVFVSEAFTERFEVRLGDTLQIPTPSGRKDLRIAGVFADYGSERGILILDRTSHVAWFKDDAARSIVLELRDPASAESVRSRLLAEFPGIQVFTNAHLRDEILRIFRQTFAITYALEAIGVAVAVLGLALTLVSILLDRREDLTTLRALGVTRRGIAISAALEGLCTTLAGLLAGLGVSLLLGWLLIHVINKQTFGWTLSFVLPVPTLAILSALVLVASLLAAATVGHWGAGLPADREE